MGLNGISEVEWKCVISVKYKVNPPQLWESFHFICCMHRTLRKWWAQYMESTGEMETALHFYEAAQDFLSLVRVYCYCGNIEKVSHGEMRMRKCKTDLGW